MAGLREALWPAGLNSPTGWSFTQKVCHPSASLRVSLAHSILFHVPNFPGMFDEARSTRPSLTLGGTGQYILGEDMNEETL